MSPDKILIRLSIYSAANLTSAVWNKEMSITAPIPAKDDVARCEATIHVSEGFHPRVVSKFPTTV
jgi:hypothetical protein